MMNPTDTNPVLVQVTRGALVESQHRGAVAVVNDDGNLVASWGQVRGLIYPRSAVKPFQAMVAVESGAFAAFGMGNRELALHCASHNGEDRHAAQVKDWLHKIGRQVLDLECGTHLPMWRTRNPDFGEAVPPSCPLHNNCSGKHAGFLTTALHMGASVTDYINPDHPVQLATAEMIGHMTGCDVTDMPRARDACRAPTFGIPLDRFAYGLARLGTQKGLSDSYGDAALRVCRAMRAFPWNVAGTGRPETLFMEDKAFTGIAKCGAEGVFAMTLPEPGLGLVVKVDDGSNRAAHIIAMAVLKYLDLLDRSALTRLAGLAKTSLQDLAGQNVGVIRPAAGIFDPQ